MGARNPRNGTWYSGMRIVDTTEAPTEKVSSSKPEPSTEDRSELPSEVEQLIERIGVNYIADLRTLSEAFNRIYAAQVAVKDTQPAEPDNGKDEQIAALRRSLAAAEAEREALATRVADLQRAQHEHDTLAVRAGEATQLRQERDALAARLQELERTRLQIMPTIADKLGMASLAPPDAVLQDTEAASSVDAQVGASSGTTAQLVIKDRPGSSLPGETAISFHPGAVVGRRPASDVRLDDAFMSAEHARLTVEEGRWWIADLGSTNGTFVNGVRIVRPTVLSEGDEIRFGRVRTRFTIEEAQSCATRPSPRSPSVRIRALSRDAGHLTDPGRNTSAG